MGSEKCRDFADLLMSVEKGRIPIMKRLRYIACACICMWLTLVFTTSSIFAQTTRIPPSDSEVPLAIVVQSINADAGAIHWIMLLLASAFLVLLTLSFNGFVQRQLRTTVRTGEGRMSLEEHIQRQSDQNA